MNECGMVRSEDTELLARYLQREAPAHAACEHGHAWTCTTYRWRSHNAGSRWGHHSYPEEALAMDWESEVVMTLRIILLILFITLLAILAGFAILIVHGI